MDELKSIMLTQSSKLQKNTIQFHLNEVQKQIKLNSMTNKNSSLGRRNESERGKRNFYNKMHEFYIRIEVVASELQIFIETQTAHFHLCISLNKTYFNC